MHVRGGGGCVKAVCRQWGQGAVYIYIVCVCVCCGTSSYVPEVNLHVVAYLQTETGLEMPCMVGAELAMHRSVRPLVNARTKLVCMQWLTYGRKTVQARQPRPYCTGDKGRPQAPTARYVAAACRVAEVKLVCEMASSCDDHH